MNKPLNRKSREHYLKNIENFYTERIFPTRDFFQTFYFDPKSKIEDEIEYTIELPDYNKKITDLFKHFPYPDLIKIIIKKLKFSQFQEQFLVQNITQDLERNTEEHLLITIEDITDLTSRFKHINNFDAHIDLKTNIYDFVYHTGESSHQDFDENNSTSESDNDH